jgi:hypothetical protein
MVQENVDFSFVQFQFHAFDIPGIGDPENLGVKLSVLNGCSPFGASPLQLHSAWAEGRAMLGSNPSADSGTKTEAGCHHGTPFHYPSLRIRTKAINPRGLGVGPQIHYPLKTRKSAFVGRAKRPASKTSVFTISATQPEAGLPCPGKTSTRSRRYLVTRICG